MTRLSIALLGTFEVVLDGQPATAFEYDKVRALLVYLAVEADRPHRRETLSALLWPDHTQCRANRNLSQALFKLRRAIADQAVSSPFLIITPQTVQFNPASDYTLDVTALTTLLATCAEHEHHTLEMCEACLDRFQQAAALYRGSFLQGFSVSNSPMFSEWATLNREQLHRLAIQTLHRLVYCHQARGQYEAAIQYAWQWVALDPWQEEAQQQLMYLLAISGQRTTALAQYKTCCRLLREELGVEPAEETTRLYEQIRDRRLSERERFFSLLPLRLAQDRPAPPALRL